MFNWVYRKADNVFLYGGPYDPQINDATQGIVQLAEHPNPRFQRFNGTNGVRNATAQERTDYDTAQLDQEATNVFDEQKAIKAVALWVAGKLSIPAGQARTEVIAVYKGLP